MRTEWRFSCQGLPDVLASRGSLSLARSRAAGGCHEPGARQVGAPSSDCCGRARPPYPRRPGRGHSSRGQSGPRAVRRQRRGVDPRGLPGGDPWRAHLTRRLRRAPQWLRRAHWIKGTNFDHRGSYGCLVPRRGSPAARRTRRSPRRERLSASGRCARADRLKGDRDAGPASYSDRIEKKS